MKQNLKLLRIKDSTLQDCIKKGRGYLNPEYGIRLATLVEWMLRKRQKSFKFFVLHLFYRYSRIANIC